MNDTDVSATTEDRCEVIQLALFGDPVTVDPLEGFVDLAEEPECVRKVMKDSFDFRDQLDLFLEGFPEPERPSAARGLYLDADGRIGTQHRLLRCV